MSAKAHILLVEPYFSGSHKQWAEEFQRHSQHEVQILSLPGRHWKWRMHGAAVTLAQEFLRSGFVPDLILATDMLDLSVFLALSRQKSAGIPVCLYFHENQLTYPWSPTDADVKLRRDNHYAFINYTSALAADHICFNSAYNQNSFIAALPAFVKQFPDFQNSETFEFVRQKSRVLPLGMELGWARASSNQHPEAEKNHQHVLLWNHRWEYDKNPEGFFKVVEQLEAEGFDFQLVIAGKSYPKSPSIFKKAKKSFQDKILHWGFTESIEDYHFWLKKATILPVTSQQDFFGLSVVEAIAAGCHPLLPNRLAYPEHIPDALKNDLIYEDEADLLEKLRALLLNSQPLISMSEEMIKRYDWATMIPQYDSLFASLAGI